MSNIPIVLLNGTVTTSNGIYEISDLEIEDAKKMVQNQCIISAVGHKATAKILSEILFADVPFNRIDFEQGVGQVAIVFKLNKRPAEGVILNEHEIYKIGYSLKKMVRLS